MSDQPITSYDPADDVPRSATVARIFSTRAFARLWTSQLFASLGDWVGLIAILAIATNISKGTSGTAVALVMAARVVPGFFLATVGGVVVDRFDRRKVMVTSNIVRAGLLVALPFVGTLLGLVLISFLLEICALLFGPAKDASVPNLVPEHRLASANSLGLIAGFGTFPVATILFTLLTVLANWLTGFDAFAWLSLSDEVIALWFNSGMFLLSAAMIWRLPIPSAHRNDGRRIDWTSALRDVGDGLRFVKDHRIVRAVIVALGIGLIGGGVMIPLGPVFAITVLDGDSTTFGVLMTTLGVGAAVGIGTLLTIQQRVPRSTMFSAATMGAGISIMSAALVGTLPLAMLFIGSIGAFAGAAYVAGFSLLQEEVSDELRGRTFATLYTVVRLCLLLALAVAPLFADFWGWVSGLIFENREVVIGGAAYTLSGVRLAIFFGGLLTLAAGVYSRRSIRAAHRGDHPSFGT